MNTIAAPVVSLPRLPRSVPRAGVSEAARMSLRQLLGDGDRRIAQAFRDGIDIDELLHTRARFVEGILAHVFSATVGERPGLALYAVGGLGRGELFPHSDVDLLALCEKKPSHVVGHALEAFFTCLWDIGLKPGHAVRTIAECREFAAADATIYTNLFDSRRLAGDASIDASLLALLADKNIWPAAAYFAAKRADQLGRYARFNDTAYNLEPNLKDAPGGLRALHLIGWLGRRLFAAPTFDTLARCGFLTTSEVERANDARRQLSRIRFALHLAAGRAEERLLFDYQRALAEQFGFVDEHKQNLAVEQFMQGYYRAASHVERLGIQIADRFEEMLEPPSAAQPVGTEFVRYGVRLAVRDPDLFMQRPAALVDIFIARLDEQGLIGFTADTMRRIHQATAVHGTALADDPQVLASFLQLLRRGAPAVDALWRMNRHGLLAAILPAFGKVFGRMQYDLFHVYTVDEHTLRVLRNVARFAEPATQAEFPLACEVWPTLPRPEVLLLAALFHDIAKGRGGDHSVLGEEDARAFGKKIGLPDDDIERVAWLVRWHLLMSTTAQRQDITDPDVVHRFAEAVGGRERLGQLYLLTIADIIGTSPRLWNAWKDRLLSDLYTATRYALRRDAKPSPDAAARIASCREQALALLTNDGHDPNAIAKVWAGFPALSFLRHHPQQIAWQTAAILLAGDKLPLIAVHPLSVRGSTELFVYAPDRDGLFANVTAMLDRLHFSVMEARVLSSPDGKAMDTFLLLEAENQKPASPERADELHQRLQRALAQSAPIMPPRRSMSRHLKHFQMAPRIDFKQANGRTQMALVCSDRPGLLAAVTQVMMASGVRVHDARIATFGERVEDFFQLTDRNNVPLSETQQQRLWQALAERIGPTKG